MNNNNNEQSYEQIDPPTPSPPPPSPPRNRLLAFYSLYPYLLAVGGSTSVTLTLTGTYLAYCIRYEIPMLVFVSAMAGIGMGLTLFTVFLSIYCVHGKRGEEAREARVSRELSSVSDIEMRIADSYDNGDA